MTQPVLIIFVDSLPFALVDDMSFLHTVADRWAINPGFGYSVNSHAELFAGLRPDDVGYFGEWMVNGDAAPARRYRFALPLLDAVCRPYVLNRGLQTVLTRRYSRGHAMPNIPLRHLDKFALEGVHIQSEHFPHPTLFTQFPQLHALNYKHVDAAKGARDAAVVEQALAAIPQHPQLYAPLPDLDGFGHKHGIDGTAYREHLARLDGWIERLSAEFQTHYPDGHIFVISDHGMANVDRGVYLDIEEQLGKTSNNSYLYFSDANLLRIWVYDDSLRQPIQNYLEQYGNGHVLSNAERADYGLTSDRFGTFIYVLREGLAFQPSTFARNIPTGMHGYHPTAHNQLAILTHSGPALNLPAPQRMSDVYHLFCHVLE